MLEMLGLLMIPILSIGVMLCCFLGWLTLWSLVDVFRYRDLDAVAEFMAIAFGFGVFFYLVVSIHDLIVLGLVQ